MDLDVVVVGGGIVGLAAARSLVEHEPSLSVAVLDKEERLGVHQTGRNSGVVHSGYSYRPGSAKALYSRAGGERLEAYCRARGIAFERCGKVVVARREAERERLAELVRRAADNEVEVELLDRAALVEREPAVAGVEALLVPSTGITDFAAVAASLAAEVAVAGGAIERGVAVERLAADGAGVVALTTDGPRRARVALNCAGLYSDRLARSAGLDPGVRIVPFRGEYYRLREPSRALVRHLVYPVPDPGLPFLGVHLHRGVDGEVHAGPNAVLAGRREGYRRRDLHPGELSEVLLYPGFWRLLYRYGLRGAGELVRSLSRRAFVASVRKLVPGVEGRDLERARSGVRAQALAADGSLVDDFLVVEGPGSIHVLNAPSPAATSCLPIGDELARRVLERLETS